MLKGVYGDAIPENTIEVFARSFFNEASAYGFGQLDYLRFVNQLLDFSIKKSHIDESTDNEKMGSTKEPENKDIFQASLQLPIEGERVVIRDIQPDQDRGLIKSWLNNGNGRHFLLSRTSSKTLDFDELVDRESSVFSLVTLISGEPIGSVAFLDYDPVQGKAELRKLIGEPLMREKGLAKEATQLWIQYGFNALAIRKIYLNTLNTNLRNIRLNEELGFKFEGILRYEVFFDGKYHDVVRMSALKE